ncbi:MAG TPA: DUF1003 domain-containing protein [Gemmatimonadaceae bacterium]|nr:DUF1003 domain-containing protein [Gemmatimonadaceae bacterium]
MTENEPGAEAAQREMVTTSGGTPLPTGVDRRGTRRSKRTHSVFRAIKAQHSGERTRMNVIADWLTNLAGTTGFFVFHVLAFASWLLWNSPIFGLPRFDPFPYGLLTMIVSLEAIFLSIFVLMSQSRESKIGELREELTLQVNLRVEEEVTKTLHLVAGLYTRLGHTLGNDPDLREMLKPLDPKQMEQEVTEQIEEAIPRLRFGKKVAAEG